MPGFAKAGQATRGIGCKLIRLVQYDKGRGRGRGTAARADASSEGRLKVAITVVSAIGSNAAGIHQLIVTIV